MTREVLGFCTRTSDHASRGPIGSQTHRENRPDLPVTRKVMYIEVFPITSDLLDGVSVSLHGIAAKLDSDENRSSCIKTLVLV